MLKEGNYIYIINTVRIMNKREYKKTHEVNVYEKEIPKILDINIFDINIRNDFPYLLGWLFQWKQRE